MLVNLSSNYKNQYIPLQSDLRPSSNRSNVGRDLYKRVWTTVAGHFSSCNICDRAVVGRQTHKVISCLHHSIDTDLLENRVRRSSTGEKDGGDERPHFLFWMNRWVVDSDRMNVCS